MKTASCHGFQVLPLTLFCFLIRCLVPLHVAILAAVLLCQQVGAHELRLMLLFIIISFYYSRRNRLIALLEALFLHVFEFEISVCLRCSTPILGVLRLLYAEQARIGLSNII